MSTLIIHHAVYSEHADHPFWRRRGKQSCMLNVRIQRFLPSALLGGKLFCVKLLW